MIKGIREQDQDGTEKHMICAFESLHWAEKELATAQKKMLNPIRKGTSPDVASMADPHLQQYLINDQ